jgi:predicted O-methyltransferase YrrM
MLYSVKREKLHEIIDGYDNDAPIDTIGKYDATMQTDAEVLVRLGLAYKVKNILEIGTSLGNTAKLLAHYFEYIYTLDNAKDEFGGHGDRTGEVARGIDNVKQLIGDCLYPEAYNDIDVPIDMVFVDDGHDYHHVVTNTFIVLEMLNERGIIVYHDTYWESVMAALEDLAKVFDVWVIEGTYLAFIILGY